MGFRALQQPIEVNEAVNAESLVKPCVSRLSSASLLVLNFQLGFVGLGVEILAMRALAPIIGTSIIATSFCIAVVVLALSFGYFLSSRSAQGNAESLLNRNYQFLALSLFVSPILLQLLKLLSNHADGDYGTGFMIRFAVAGLLGPFLIGGMTSVCVGTCSPLVLELMGSKEKLRDAAVRCFVVAGIGSLLGSLLPNFVLIPLLGVNKSLVFMASVIGLTSIALLDKGRAKKLRSTLVLLSSLCISLGLIALLSQQPPGTLEVRETSYQTIYLREKSFFGNRMQVLEYDDRLGVQSVYDPDLKLLGSPFYAGTMILLNRYVDVNVPKSSDGHYRVLVLGSAGGTLSSQAEKLYGNLIPGLDITNVDIDPVVHELAQTHFGAANSHTHFVTDDARTFIEKTSEKYDYVMVDVFSKGLSIPSEALSVEFFSKVKRILKPTGVVLFNLAAPSENSALIKVALGSLQKNFPNTTISQVTKDVMVKNYLVSASQQPVDYEKLIWLAPTEQRPEFRQGLKTFVHSTKVAEASDISGDDDSVSSESLSLQILLELWGKYRNT